MKDHKISLNILYDCYIAQAKLLRMLINDLEEEYEKHFVSTKNIFKDELINILEHNDEIRDINYDEGERIDELYKLHDHMLDNAEELSCHLLCGRIETNKVYDYEEKKYEKFIGILKE